jgi:hypothetical protein
MCLPSFLIIGLGKDPKLKKLNRLPSASEKELGENKKLGSDALSPSSVKHKLGND